MSTTAKQLEIPALMEAAAFAQQGEIPEGVADLSPREVKFVTGLLTHGQQGRAYEDAGFKASGDAAFVGASKLLRKPKVFRFYRQCLGHVSQNAGRLIDRVWERSIIFHEKTVRAAQEVGKLDDLILESKLKEDGLGPKGPIERQTKKWITRREQMKRDERLYAGLARADDTLLGQLLGRIKDLNVSVDVTLSKVVSDGAPITSDVLDTLAANYRQRMENVMGGRN